MTEKKAFHEYRKRPPTEDELNLATKMLADGKTVHELAKALRCGDQRAKRIMDMLEVQRNAIHLRETVMVPNALNDLYGGIHKLVDGMIDLSARLDKLESICQRMNKALGYSKLRNRKQREAISNLKAERKLLIDGYRKRGLIPPCV